ncbi:MAG: lysylphosphatidylglycerol synthase transmembrane domain-containing protein [Planctomycetota bacterium]
MNPKVRKRLFTGLRIIICAVALAWVLHGVTWHDYVTLQDGRQWRALEIDERERTVTIEGPGGEPRTCSWAEVAVNQEGQPRITCGLVTAWRRSRTFDLLLSLAAFAPVTFLQSWRFRLVFRAQGITLSYGECVKLCFTGNFLNFVTPIGTTAGDVFKAYHVARHTDRKTEALTTILLDRLIGLGCLLLLVGITIEVGAEDPLLRKLGHLINTGLVAAVVLVGLFFSTGVRERWLPRGLAARLPLLEHVRRVDAATRRLLQHVPYFGGSVVLTLVLQFFAVSSFVLAAYALRMNFTASKVFDYYACIGAGLVVAAIPISFQGLGTSEAVYRQFMLGSHGTLSQLLWMAMAVRLIQLLWSLPGLLVGLTGAYKLRATAGPAETG